MIYKILGLKHTVSGEDELVELANEFSSKEEALNFIKDNLKLEALNDVKSVVNIEVDGISYHYFEVTEA